MYRSLLHLSTAACMMYVDIVDRGMAFSYNYRECRLMGSLSKVPCYNNTCVAHFQNFSCSTSYPPHRVEKFGLESRHPLIEYHLLQECHQHNFAVALARIARFQHWDNGAQGEAVDIARPVFNFCRSLHALFVALSGN